MYNYCLKVHNNTISTQEETYTNLLTSQAGVIDL